PALDEVDPRGARRREVNVEARMFEKPASDRWCLVRAEIVEHDVDVEVFGHCGVDGVEKLLELDGTVPAMQLADHSSRHDVECCEQRRRAMTYVIVASTLGIARLHRQEGLSPIERLDLRFLVDAKHESTVWRVQIEADNIAHLLDELRVLGQFERLYAVRLKAKSSPNPAHCRLAHA